MGRKYNRPRNCLQCGKEFITYKSSHKQWCSRVCYYQSCRDLRPKVYCAACGSQLKITRYRKTRNDEYYCNKDCYNNRRSQTRKKNKRQTKFMMNFISNGCIDCGEKREYLLNIHHIDGNPINNIDSNLEVVCANCHIKRHLGINNGKIVYGPKYYLTPRNLLSSY